MSNLQVTPITGLPQVDGWAQVVTHPSRDLICVLSVAGKNANSVGKTLSEQITHFPITNAAQLHNNLLDLLQTARNEECRVQLACILFADSKSVIATNDGSVFLKRREKIGEILKSEGELKLIEGSRVVGDIFVLATRQTGQLFPNLKSQLAIHSEDLAPELVADLQNQENSSLAAMAWIEQTPASAASQIRDNLSSISTNKSKLNWQRGWQKISSIIPSHLLKNPALTARKAWTKVSGLVTGAKPTRLSHLDKNGLLARKPKFLTRNFLMGAGVVIVILLSLIFWKQHQVNQELATLEPTLSELQQQFTEAKTKAENEPIAARSETRDVLKGLEDLIAANQDKKSALKALKDQYQLVQAFAETIAGTENQELEPFFDLRLAEANFVAKQISVTNDQLVALDASGGRAVLVNLASKQTEQITFDDGIGSGRAITTGDDHLYLLANGLHSFDLAADNTHELLKEQGDSDRGGTLLGNFTSYLYVFNPEERNIYRYLMNDDGLSDPIGWLTNKQGLEFSEVDSMAIDGDLWLATNSGQIFKYTQGSPQDFTITDLPTNFDSPIQIATHPDSEYLFVLEKAKHRLVILRKDGSFLKEIVSDELASAETIAASLTENAAFMVSGSLVYKISF